MRTYISPVIKTWVPTRFMQHIYDVVSTAAQLGSEGIFDQEEGTSAPVTGKSVWDD